MCCANNNVGISLKVVNEVNECRRQSNLSKGEIERLERDGVEGFADIRKEEEQWCVITTGVAYDVLEKANFGFYTHKWLPAALEVRDGSGASTDATQAYSKDARQALI
jgi:hypothetical protein